MTQVGYETEGLALVVLAGLALFAKAGVGGSAGLKIALIPPSHPGALHVLARLPAIRNTIEHDEHRADRRRQRRIHPDPAL